ncbi:MAG: DUF115 domain-containing protein [Succinivibrio sp.]|nr:DUF115 domain-containing protein [Succinivibrio sp.]
MAEKQQPDAAAVAQQNPPNPQLEAVVAYLNFQQDEDLQRWFASFTEERLARNLQAFKQFDPDLYALLSQQRLSGALQLFCNAEGVANLLFKESEHFLYPTSDSIAYCRQQVEHFLSHSPNFRISSGTEYDPFGQLAFKYSNTLKTKVAGFAYANPQPCEVQSIPLLMCNGIGLGYQLAEILSRVEVCNVILVEPDLNLFYASLLVFDWENFLNFVTENGLVCRFVLGQKTDYILLYLRHFLGHHGIFWALGLHILNHYQSEAVAKLFQQVTSSLGYLLHTGFIDDSIFGICHTCTNLSSNRSFVTQGKLPQHYARMPVFVVGSGPSLDQDIDFIRKFQDKAVIIACGTSIDALYHAGIQPDFYANTERTPEIVQTLQIIPDQSFFDDIILLCTNVCNPLTVAFFKHTAIFSKDNESQISHLAHFEKKLRTIATINGINPLVGNMGVSGALHLGFKKLYLFGIDNGKKVGSSVMHSAFTTLYHQHGANDSVGAYQVSKTLPANFGGEVETNNLYAESAQRIGEILQYFKERDAEVACFNCSDGIRIQHAAPQHAQELIAQFAAAEDLPKAKLHAYLQKHQTQAFSITKNQIKQIFNEKIFNEICNKIQEQLNADFNSRLTGLAVMHHVSEYLAKLQLSDDRTIYGQCLDGSLQLMFCHVLAVLYSDHDEQKCVSEAKDLLAIMQDFLTECPELFSKIPDYVMGEHRKFYKDGKIGRDMPHCAAPKLPAAIKLACREYEDPQKKFVKRYA